MGTWKMFQWSADHICEWISVKTDPGSFIYVCSELTFPDGDLPVPDYPIVNTLINGSEVGREYWCESLS